MIKSAMFGTGIRQHKCFCKCLLAAQMILITINDFLAEIITTNDHRISPVQQNVLAEIQVRAKRVFLKSFSCA